VIGKEEKHRALTTVVPTAHVVLYGGMRRACRAHETVNRDPSEEEESMYRKMLGLLVMGGLIVLAHLTMAQEKQPDATLHLSTGSVAVGIGFTWGSGVLTYKGKEYPFSIEGLSVVDVGISKAEATGSVYDLKRLEDFNGNYTGVTAGVTVAGGAGATAVQNQNGVVINLVGTSQGLKFKLSVDGVKMTLKGS
jgi:hypothetical protein